MPTTLVAADASFTIVRKGKRRVIPAVDFFTDYFANKLGRTDILTEVTVPVLPARSGSTYMKLSRRAGDFAIVGSAAVVSLGKGDLCKQIRVALGAVGTTPIRALKVEKGLKGKILNDDLIVEASQLASEGVDPPSDIHGSAEYRREMTKVMAKRVIREAWRRAKG
jgi:carbon-monoxide dehydrogenase medium subunit